MEYVKMSDRNAKDAALITDDVIWRPEVCVDAGIFRAFATYTNPDVQKAFNELPGSYSGNYYEIRKYNKLVPGGSYFVTMAIETGNTEGIPQPRDWEEWEYGICGPGTIGDQNQQTLNFSGVKLISDFDSDEILIETSRNEAAQYGKSVSITENLMAVGAPRLTIYDEYDNEIPSGGAVFLYRRNADIAGRKASWDLDKKLVLPSGFIRDFVASTPGAAIKYPQNGETQFSIPFQQWEIGQEGREFGHSVALSASGDKETVVVGAPHAAWSRQFADLNISGIPVCMAVFSDQFKALENNINRVANEARVFDVLYTYFAERWNLPEFDFNPRLDIKILIFLPVSPVADKTNYFVRQDFVKYAYIDKLSNNQYDGVTVTVDSIADQIKAEFLKAFPLANLPHSGLPPILGIFSDNSFSTDQGRDIDPSIEKFIDFYKAHVYTSGVIDPETSYPSSGYVNRTTGAAQNWAVDTVRLLRETLDSGNLIEQDAMRYIASGFSSNANPALGTFQIAPPSGGKVYIFDKEENDINLVQEIKTFYRRPSTILIDDDELYDDLMNLDYGKDYHDRFGHAVDISKDGKIVAIGSPFTPRPCEVFERVDSENERMYSKIRDWFVHASGRHDYNGLDNSRLDFSTNIQRYDELLADSGQTVAQKQSYLELNPSDKFFYRTDSSFWGSTNTIELYKKIYDYKYTDIPYTGTWGFLPAQFAPTSRLGYSCAVSDTGNIVAFGAPTDSFNEFDDFNVWYGGTTDLGSGNNRWISTTNAGAVRLFESRKFYPHSGVVEFTRFGNLDRSLNLDDPTANYDRMDVYFGADIAEEINTKPRSFRRMGFEEKRIPQDVGVAFIITPERDVISQAGGEEILEGIKEWLSLGDRTLVLVANDPKYEDGGAYAKSTDIINNILEKLDSRMVVKAARNEQEALLDCTEEGSYNVVEAFQPEYNHTTFSDYRSFISTDNIYAMGVADIRMRLHKDEISVFSGNGVQMPCNDPVRILNPEPELFLKEGGDLRAQWNSICSKCGPNGCVEFEYKTNWPMYFDNPNPSQSCDQYPLVGNLDSPYQDPRPILTAAALTPDVVVEIPEIVIPEKCTSGEILKQVCVENGFPITRLKENHIDQLAFNIYEPFEPISGPSGLFNSYNLGNSQKGEFFNPSALNFRNPILQAKGKSETKITKLRDAIFEVSPDSPLLCQETPSYAPQSSRVVMIASTRPETALNLGGETGASAGIADENIPFYAQNLVKKNCDNPATIYLIGGWTGRERFEDVISDFEEAGGGHEERTKSALADLLIRTGHTVVEGVTDVAEYVNADILWIADPTGFDEQGVADLSSWLTLEDKTLVITYNIQPTQFEEDQFGNRNVISNAHDTVENVIKICKKLGLDMTPAHYTNPAGSTEYFIHSSFDEAPQIINYEYDMVSGCELGNWRGTSREDTFIDYLTVYRDDKEAPGRRTEFNFIPIINAHPSGRVINYSGKIERREPRFREDTRFTINTNSSITFPVVDSSGYKVFINYVSETDDDKIDTGFAISDNSTADGSFAFGELKKTELGKVAQQSFTIEPGTDASEITVAFNASSTELFTGTDVFEEPRSVRIVSISGCPIPYETIIVNRQTCKWVHDRWEVTCEPGITIPASSIIILGTLEPISTSRKNYVKPSLVDCDNITTDTLIEDGPVIAAEELENFSSFSSGKRRSRIVVITDPTIVQGRCTHYRDNAVGDNQKFIRSLYLPSPQEYIEERNFENVEYYDTGTKFEYVQKVRSPEAGSPAKYYSLLNEYGLTKRFGEPSLSPVAGNQTLYRSDEDSFAPANVYRKKNPKWDEIDPETDKFIDMIEADYGIYPRFSGVFQGYGPLTNAQKDEAGVPRFKMVDGKLVEINLDYYPQDQDIRGGISVLQKLTGRDYLDYIDTFSGFPGDLFGYSIDLSNDKLIVGTPFNGFAPNKVWDWTDVSGDPNALTWKLSEYGGAGAAFFFQRTGNGVNAKSQFLPFEYKDKLKPESANVGVSGGLTAINIQRQKNIGTERHQDHTDEDFRQTDQFGRSVAVASDMFAIGAPNHDWITEHYHVYDGESAFLRKEFTAEFDIPAHNHPESSGNPVLNDGAVYTYRDDLVDFGGRRKEVVLAEKLNKQGYKGRFASSTLDPLGTENDKFGASVAIHRSFRGDSDYTLVGGAINHDYPTSGNHTTGFLKNAGAAFTFDAMLREQPAVIPTEGGYIYARTFGPENSDVVSITVEQPVSGKPVTHKVSGVVFANRFGEIYLEGSGFDPATKGFTAHRPYVKYVAGTPINGTFINNSVNLVMEGVSRSGQETLPLFVKDTNGGYVYNKVELYTSGNIDYASGDFNLYVSGDRFFNNDQLNLFVSGVTEVNTASLNLGIRGK
jgi:hypothetical protein